MSLTLRGISVGSLTLTPSFDPYVTSYTATYDPDTVTRIGRIEATKALATDSVGSRGQGAQTPVGFCGYRKVGTDHWAEIQKAQAADANPEYGNATFALNGESWEIQIVVNRGTEETAYTVTVTPET